MTEEDFSHQISYFFGCNNTKPIMDLYLKALKQPEESMLKTIHQVYNIIEAQTPFTFDTQEAAKIELEIIKACRSSIPFDDFCALYQKIYAHIFNQPKSGFRIIAELRAFIFTLQRDIEQSHPLTEEEKNLIISTAQLSKSYLEKFELLAANTN